MDERELTDSEKIKLIKTILQTKGLSGVIDYINGLQEKANKEINTIEEPPISISKVEVQDSSSHNSELSGEVASIYNTKYHGLVAGERTITTENPSVPPQQSNEEVSDRGPVREKKLPNPWGDAEAVKPGQLKL